MPNKSLKKKEFDDKAQALLDEFSTLSKYKEQEYYSCGEVFLDVVGLPGPAIGHLNQFIGHSDSGKTAAMILAAIDAQKRGDLPVFIITEQKWSFEHAKLMGLTCEQNKDGQWKGLFIFRDGFEYVEQVTDYINALLDKQDQGKLPYNLAIFWDSVGSIPCKLTFEGKGGKQHTAGVLSEKIGMGLNSRITSTRKAEKPFTNTMTILVQPWVWTDQKNPNSAPRIQGKGGNAIYINSTLVFQFGNIMNSGTSAVNAAKGGRKVKFATRTKVSVIKNHINGLGFVDGQIIITPHNFIKNDDNAIKKYKNEFSDYWRKVLETDGDFDLSDEEDTAKNRANKDIEFISDVNDDSSNN